MVITENVLFFKNFNALKKQWCIASTFKDLYDPCFNDVANGHSQIHSQLYEFLLIIAGQKNPRDRQYPEENRWSAVSGRAQPIPA